MSEAPAFSWRNPVPADIEYRASGAIKNNKSLPGIVREALALSNREQHSNQASCAKASGLFALDVEIMNLKAIINRIASRFMSEAKTGIEVVSNIIETENPMDETQAAHNAAAAANLNRAIQIALALKSIDPSLTVDAVQAGTNAALVALYPAA